VKHLFAPWRSSWIQSAAAGSSAGGSCLFCRCWDQLERDAENLVLYRARFCLVMLNRYPYSGGHALIVPREHTGSLSALTVESREELIALASRTLEVLERRWSPQGYNIGINQGVAAGAGIPDHIHGHVVPRWSGDTNFMSTIGGTRVVSIDLAETRTELAAEFVAAERDAQRTTQGDR
jgi:ATP adenylyltransferase